MFFYLAIDHLPLGKGVTIEFIGPIAVAAFMTRSLRNTYALLLATVGVVVLGGVELGNEPLGLVFILAASAMWAAYIVIGSRVAMADHGVAGLGIGLIAGGILITPFASTDASLPDETLIMNISPAARAFLYEAGNIFRFTVRFFREVFRPRYEVQEFVHQCYIIGNKSLPLVGLTDGTKAKIKARPSIGSRAIESMAMPPVE